jgi:hypothetical protein
MGDPPGEADRGALRLDFDRRLILQFRGSATTSNAGLLAYRELHDTLGLTNTGADTLADLRTGKNGRRRLVGLRQSVFGRLAGYGDVNDAERLRRDPAMCWVVGNRAITKSAASASQMGRVEARWPSRPENLPIFPASPLPSCTNGDRRSGLCSTWIRARARPMASGKATFQMAEVAVLRQIFDILSLIARLLAPPVPAEGQRHQMRQATTAEVRLDAV